MFSEFISPASRDKLDALSLLIARRIPSWSISGPKPGPALRRLPAHEALHQPYLQFNHAATTGVIIVDCDHPDLDAWRDARLPLPNYIVYNKTTLRHHLGWILKNPVYHGVKSAEKPKRLLDHVRRILTSAAQGDPFYTNQIGRNPIAPGDDCQTIALHPEPYDLRELFDAISDNVPDTVIAAAGNLAARTHSEDDLGSRNCTLFHTTRRLAYQIRSDHSDPKTFESAILALAMAGNTFPVPLSISEVRSIARSISKWAWKKIPADYRPSRFHPDQYSTPGAPFSFATRPSDYSDLPTHRRRGVMASRCWKIRFDEAVFALLPLLRQPYAPAQGERRIANRFCAYTIEQLAAHIGLCRAAAHPKITAARQWLAIHGIEAEQKYRETNPDIAVKSEYRPRRNPRKPYSKFGARRRLAITGVNPPKRCFSDIVIDSRPPDWRTRQPAKWQPPIPAKQDPDSWFNSGRFEGDWKDYQTVLEWQSRQPPDYWSSICWDSRPPWEKGSQDANGVWHIAKSSPDDIAA